MDLLERIGDGSVDDPRHPWEEARARFFLELLVSAHALSATTRVLDVGAGDAFFARRLLERVPGAEVTAWDVAYTDDEVAAPAPVGLRRTQTGPQGTWDLVLLLDVLEHVNDDARMLEEVRGLLAPAGRVLVSVPAWPGLFSIHDSRLHHRRRYHPLEAQALIERAGFVVVERGGLFHSLVIPRALGAVVSSRIGRGSLAAAPLAVSPALRGLLALTLRADTLLSRAFARAQLAVPGLSWWALCARGRA